MGLTRANREEAEALQVSDSPPPSAHGDITRHASARPRDPPMATKLASTRPHLLSNELTLLDYAADDVRDIVTLSEKEALVLQLASQIQEQQLEKALLEQGTIYFAERFLILRRIYDGFIFLFYFAFFRVMCHLYFDLLSRVCFQTTHLSL